ncbi:MarP family serine protease [Pseudonocardia adelaidensis]|uniref:Acid resistance serine protease MarP n=1 Tax=Pseudonocardia adelaidensis TaxID=648754 RepID=A0ABP9NLL4_9PSEU
MEGGDLAPNVLDAVLLLLLVFVAARGWRRGAVAQICAFGGLALGLIIGVWGAPRLVGLFVSEPGPTTALVTVGLLLFAALIGQGVGLGVGLRLRRAALSAGIGRIDRVAGVAAGAAGLVFAVWLLATVLAQGPIPALARQVRGSEVVRALDAVLPPPPDVFGRISAYLDDQGFPPVFAQPGGGGIVAPSVPATADEAVRAAAAAGQPSTVQVRASGCGGVLGFGSGFVPQAGFVVTNAHVVAGFDHLTVRDSAGEHDAVPIHVNPALDLAVLAVPDVGAPPIGWAGTPVVRGTEGATLGFPGGHTEMVVQPASVKADLDAIGRDIYGTGRVHREIIALSGSVERGDSGGPFVTSDGLVGGVVFAADPSGGTAYALAVDEVRPAVEDAIRRNQEVGVGECRF